MLGELELTYLVKDDVLVITTPELAESQRLIRVYDCRELLELERPRGSVLPKVTRGGMGGGGFFAVQDEPVRKVPAAAEGDNGAGHQPPATAPASPPSDATAPPAASAPSGGQGGALFRFGSSGSGDGDAAETEMSDAENLSQFITTIVDPDSWDDVGGPGSIAEYKGLISVASTQAVHEKVERLLNMLHQAANLKELKVTVVE